MILTQVLILRHCPQAVKIALALASWLGDPMYDTSVAETVAKMLK